MTEGIVYFYGVLAIAYLILIVVLIVKFFQMAGDLKSLKEKIVDVSELSDNNSDIDSLDFLIVNGYIEEAKRLLLKIIWNDESMIVLRRNRNPSTNFFDLHYGQLAKKYNDYFQRIGEEFPNYDFSKKNNFLKD